MNNLSPHTKIKALRKQQGRALHWDKIEKSPFNQLDRYANCKRDRTGKQFVHLGIDLFYQRLEQFVPEAIFLYPLVPRWKKIIVN